MSDRHRSTPPVQLLPAARREEPVTSRLSDEARDALLQTLAVKVEGLDRDLDSLEFALRRHGERLTRNDVIAQGLRHDLQLVSGQMRELTETLGVVKDLLVDVLVNDPRADA